MLYLRVNCTPSLHHVIECTPKLYELSVQYRTTVIKKAADVGMLSYDTEDAMTCIDNKYGLHELSNLY